MESRRFLGGRTPVLQRIRGPQQTMQGPATCLDLALVLAGMAMSVEFRTFLGIRGGAEPHALVILDLNSPRGDDPSRPLPGFARAALQGDDPWPARSWQPPHRPEGRTPWRRSPGLATGLCVDVYQAAVTAAEPQGRDFSLASGRRAVSSLREDEARAEQLRRDAAASQAKPARGTWWTWTWREETCQPMSRRGARPLRRSTATCPLCRPSPPTLRAAA